MRFKCAQSIASGRPAHDQENHPTQQSPLPPADVHQLSAGRTQLWQLLPSADVMAISHDSANRFLQRERYEGKDLSTASAPHLNLKGGTLSVDDCVLDKPYSQYLAFVGYFWSGKHPVP